MNIFRGNENYFSGVCVCISKCACVQETEIRTPHTGASFICVEIDMEIIKYCIIIDYVKTSFHLKHE